MSPSAKLSSIFFFSTIIFIHKDELVNAAPPNLDVAFSALCQKMTIELNCQMETAVYASKIPQTMVMSKSEFARHLFAKIELLEGILAEMELYRPGFSPIKKKYFFDNNSVQNFLNFYYLAKGRPQNFVKFFSKKQSDKLHNYSLNSNNQAERWIMEELIRRTKPLKFLKILERIQSFEIVPEKINPEKFPGVPKTYREMQTTMKVFLEKLKQEIVFGQTYIGFNEISEKIAFYEKEIDQKIKEADEKLALKENILSKIGKYKSEAKKFEAEKGFDPLSYKELMLKYKNLNNICADMYYELMEKIPRLMAKKERKEKTQMELKTFELAQKLKKTFAKILPQAIGHINLSPAPSPVVLQNTHLNPESGPSNAVKKGKNKEEEGENGTKLLELIEFHLFLPNKWLNEEGKLFRKNGESWLRPKIRLNAGMLLLAYERMKKFYDD